ncbi:hypothetical protein Pelo_18948 [Pelomyxa schiedti]|nr:hypothetical protein Pelo_18948 [Pelomyxa schiedti]
MVELAGSTLSRKVIKLLIQQFHLKAAFHYRGVLHWIVNDKPLQYCDKPPYCAKFSALISQMPFVPLLPNAAHGDMEGYIGKETGPVSPVTIPYIPQGPLLNCRLQPELRHKINALPTCIPKYNVTSPDRTVTI